MAVEESKIGLLGFKVVLNDDEEQHQQTNYVRENASNLTHAVHVVGCDWKVLFDAKEVQFVVLQIVKPAYFLF